MSSTDFLKGYLESVKDLSDSIIIPRKFIDITGNLADAAILARILYWHGDGKDGKSRLRVQKDGHLWLVKNYSDWMEECHIPEREARYRIQRLKKLGLIIASVGRFNNKNALFIRVNPVGFQKHVTKSVTSSDKICQVVSDKNCHIYIHDSTKEQDSTTIEDSAPQNPTVIEMPQTSQLPQVEIEDSPREIPLVDEKPQASPKPKAKKTERESIWYTLTLEKAKQAGWYTYSKTFEGKDPAQTKPYWNLIAGMVAWNKIGKSWQEYLDLIKGKEIAAFTKQIKNACLAWEEYSDPEDPITVEELEWIVSYWHFQQMDDKQAKERFFPVSGQAVENNISALRARYRLHIKSLASHHREVA